MMRNHRSPLATTLCAFALAAVMTLPTAAAAQCGMMGAGGHDHGAAQNAEAKKLPAAEKKQRESVRRLLEDEQGRRVLADMLLEDRDFTRDLLARMLAIPELRAFVTDELAQPAAAPRAPEAAPAIAYACPMHPEVTSSKPDKCPKCGMALVRVTPDRTR